MSNLDASIGVVRRVLEKEKKLTADDLQVLRNNTVGAQGHSSKSDSFMFRMEIELIDAIRALDETSAKLIEQTNKLTSRILVLTVVGVFVAVVGVAIAAIQLFR